MRVILLGTAAGGGYPQWNCACPMCAGGFPARTQDCLAISADGRGWYLINVSPDIRAQLLATPWLRAGPGPRDTPLRGALLTDAELDHTLGLTMLREGSGLQVFAPPAVLTALHDDFPLRPLVARYGSWSWEPVPALLDGLAITAFPVSAKRPKYVRSEVDSPWVVAYRIESPTGSLVYAPCLATWPPGFDDLVANATCVILDGTFYSPAELSTTTPLTAGAQHAMGHLPISGPDGTLTRIKQHPGRRWLYTHLNNTNPLVNPSSPEHTELRAAGAEAPPDGTTLEI